jgi:hypothetical protein
MKSVYSPALGLVFRTDVNDLKKTKICIRNRRSRREMTNLQVSFSNGSSFALHPGVRSGHVHGEAPARGYYVRASCWLYNEATRESACGRFVGIFPIHHEISTVSQYR